MHAPPAFRTFVVALALVAALAGLALSAARPLVATLDGAVLALGQRLRPAPPGDYVWIDTGADAGVDRGELAAAVETLHAGRARVIVVTQPLEGPGSSADFARVRSFLDSTEAATDPALRARLQSWAAELDHDARLERTIRAAGNVVLLARSGDEGSAAMPRYGGAAPVVWPSLRGEDLEPARSLVPPLPRFAGAAFAVGVEPAAPADADGVRRVDALLVGDAGGGTLALPAAAWLASRRTPPGAASWDHGLLRAGSEALAADADAGWVPWYARAGSGGHRRWSLADLVAGQVPAAAVTGRAVVLGPAAPVVRTPAGTLSTPEALGQRMHSLEAGTYVQRPAWAWLVVALVLLAAAPLYALAGARLSPAARIASALALAAALVAAELGLLLGARVWVPLVTAALAFPLVLLATVVAARPQRDGSTGPVPARGARAAAPVTPRLRPPATAAAAGSTGASYPEADARRLPSAGRPPAADTGPSPTSLRDISDRLRARQEEPTRSDVADLLLGRSKRPPKPRLGRYELERELGRGAMGVVYLGRDPNINRVVAVKAIPLTQEFEGEALTEARTRFFREAEMAGRLQHPSIVTVYDAGEDGGIAFIAMEYVRGRLLSEHATSDVLLPAPQVLEIVARIADALDYAHTQDIVHRDIKPANAIFDPATLETKITDFGIARLTNSSATRTGIVLGTPSFMAPEQLEGRNVTGRSDLFSLGVTLFQLLAGQLPFRADSMTGLMDKIANSPHPPLRTIRPDLPPCVGLIVDRALQKDPAHRFVTAAEMARALRACARSLAA